MGFWVKLLDGLLEEHLDAVLAPLGLTRRQWQLLNLLAVAPRSPEAVAEQLGAFLDGPATGELLAGARDAGLVAVDGPWLALTPGGEARRREAADTVAAARDNVAAGVERAEYATTVATLERMCRNLGWAS